MFSGLLDEAMGLTDSELDERLRENELVQRATEAERAALLTVSVARGAYRVDGQRTVNGYLRATMNLSKGAAAEDRKIAEACNTSPALGDALAAGHIGVAQVLEIARIHSNPRTRQFFSQVAPIYVEFAEHDSHLQLKRRIDNFINLADQDGAFAELVCNIEQRAAQAHVVGGTLDVRIHGGDPLVAEEFVATFDMFVEAEFRGDLDARRAEHGDAADQFPLARSDRQRRFDAAIAMARAARQHLADGGSAEAAELVIDVVADPQTLHDVFDDAGMVTTETGDVVDLDDATIGAVLVAAAEDPTEWIGRRCETAGGVPIHPILLLKAAMTGHLRRVLIDSDSVVIDRGRATRLFTGEARAAAKLLFQECAHPGCSVKVRYAEVDHIDEWHEGGHTDQRNSAIECKPHNLDKHRERWRTRRDEHGRVFTIRADGSIMLPVGARAPDLSWDEMGRAARARAAAIRPAA
jgi:hypothetical protein